MLSHDDDIPPRLEHRHGNEELKKRGCVTDCKFAEIHCEVANSFGVAVEGERTRPLQASIDFAKVPGQHPS